MTDFFTTALDARAGLLQTYPWTGFISWESDTYGTFYRSNSADLGGETELVDVLLVNASDVADVASKVTLLDRLPGEEKLVIFYGKVTNAQVIALTTWMSAKASVLWVGNWPKIWYSALIRRWCETGKKTEYLPD